MVGGETASTPGPGATPVPDNGIVREPTVLLMVRVPADGVGVDGEKRTVALTDCPAASTVPAAGSPTAENGAVNATAEPRVSEPTPELLMTMVCSAVVPLVTLPKSIGSGNTDSTPGAGSTPTPVSEMLDVPAELTMLSVPLNEPALAGAKVTVAVTEAPGASVAPGAGSDDIENGAVGSVNEPSVSALPPTLLMVTERVLLCPADTLPWSTTAGVTESTPGLTPVLMLTFETACWSS